MTVHRLFFPRLGFMTEVFVREVTQVSQTNSRDRSVFELTSGTSLLTDLGLVIVSSLRLLNPRCFFWNGSWQKKQCPSSILTASDTFVCITVFVSFVWWPGPKKYSGWNLTDMVQISGGRVFYLRRMRKEASGTWIGSENLQVTKNECDKVLNLTCIAIDLAGLEFRRYVIHVWNYCIVREVESDLCINRKLVRPESPLLCLDCLQSLG